MKDYFLIRILNKKLYLKETIYFLFRSILVRILYKITVNVAILGFPTQTLREGYDEFSARKKGFSDLSLPPTLPNRV